MAKVRTVNMEVTFTMVARIVDGKNAVSTEDFLKNRTQWLGEPTDASGAVIAIRYKSHIEKASRKRDEEA